MPLKLTIDGREVEVEKGATVLDAARRLGIHVPTLCYLEGVRAAGSCSLCVVQIEGLTNLVPSCVAPAEDGMVVTTDSDDIRAARRMALELLLSDHRGDCEAPCTLACPAGLDIPGFLRHIAAHRHREAIALVKETIPLAGALGRVCPRYCERVCRRREVDEAVAICALKRFAADTDYAAGQTYIPHVAPPTDRRVAIVGAGPAGLSAAYYLLAAGHDCVILDACPEPGGMFRYGIPEFRLPKGLLAREIDVIREMGAELRMNTRLGVDVDLEELRRDYNAVLLAMGAQKEQRLECEGRQFAASALEFLRQASDGAGPEVGDAVIVLGDGDEAVDAARTALRLGAERVVLVSERARSKMGCFSERADEAEAEGVKMEFSAKSVAIERDEAGRFKVVWRRDRDTFSAEAFRVISAPERCVDTS